MIYPGNSQRPNKGSLVQSVFDIGPAGSEGAGTFTIRTWRYGPTSIYPCQHSWAFHLGQPAESSGAAKGTIFYDPDSADDIDDDDPDEDLDIWYHWQHCPNRL